MNNPYDWIDRSLQTIHRAGWTRHTRTLTGLPGTVINIDGQVLLNFASNDYLGLASDDRLIQAAIQATEGYGTGSTGSRLITGHRQLHRDLEMAIATLKQTEDALVFSSGYAANIGTIAALVGKRDLILCDAYNHSSLRNGAIVSGATLLDYHHCDLVQLSQQLETHRKQFQRCLIITDSVFSMDGDLCPLAELFDVAAAFDCMVLVDEAHGTGVLGKNGAGGIEHCGCTGRPAVQMGTLSKAIGSLGGYIAGSAPLIDFLRHRAASWIYSTGLSPADTAAALAAVTVIQTEPDRRDRLWQNIVYLKQKLAQLPNLPLLPSDSAIICIAMPNVQTAMNFSQYLQSAGILALAIRPPTVPTSRIRLTLMATHTPAQIDQLVIALAGAVVNAPR
ncbi:8-amino-7-oxononanoate synthase [Romeriopsis navalis]|nr:8-amino-7-oxononanoate synthase [Romeriopsis navalis]